MPKADEDRGFNLFLPKCQNTEPVSRQAYYVMIGQEFYSSFCPTTTLAARKVSPDVVVRVGVFVHSGLVMSHLADRVVVVPPPPLSDRCLQKCAPVQRNFGPFTLVLTSKLYAN